MPDSASSSGDDSGEKDDWTNPNRFGVHVEMTMPVLNTKVASSSSDSDSSSDSSLGRRNAATAAQAKPKSSTRPELLPPVRAASKRVDPKMFEDSEGDSYDDQPVVRKIDQRRLESEVRCVVDLTFLAYCKFGKMKR